MWVRRPRAQVIAEREEAIGSLSSQLDTMAQEHEATRIEGEERQRQAQAAHDAMAGTVDGLQRTIDRKRADLREMQARLVNAKNSYDSEVVRKQAEVSELEGSMRQLHTYTAKMSTFTQQVQEQIMQRERDMKTQLALMKNTIAFALYIDESLQVDLTDPYSTQLLASPVIVLPSGVTYSAETVAKLQSQAERRGQSARCPQTGEVISATVPNAVVESILSRYLFKQQITKDVMHALAEYQVRRRASGVGPVM